MPALVSLGQPKGTAHEVQHFAGGRSYPLNEPRSRARQSERPRFSHGRSCGEFGQPRDGAEDGNDDREWRPSKSERKWYIDIWRERGQWRCGRDKMPDSDRNVRRLQDQHKPDWIR